MSPSEALINISRSHRPKEDGIGQSPIRRQSLVDHVPYPYPTLEMRHGRACVSFHLLRDPCGRQSLEKGDGGRDVPHQDVSLDDHVAGECPIDHDIDVGEIVSSQTGGGRVRVYGSRERVDQG